MSFKQREHLRNLAIKRHENALFRLKNTLSYDLSFYRFKNGKLNVSKLARCSGLSRGFLEKHLWFRGL
ncbi:hypothetical protein [Campylobacter concisus]|uniref:hypothetical protein n=1 Tax=Campylobacter concisus TaxID=199 RepID=UPI000CD9AF50|nr:hypothetical protein [Campylobacter concisus]